LARDLPNRLTRLTRLCPAGSIMAVWLTYPQKGGPSPSPAADEGCARHGATWICT
jgi:hypothetical protein